MLHGGAGVTPEACCDAAFAHMRELIERADYDLRAGAAALEVAVNVVSQMEISGLYIAGRGASPGVSGLYELDACVMDSEQRAGAVAALVGFRAPVLAALAVLEHSPHVLLAGEGAASFARAHGCAEIDASEAWYTHAGRDEANNAGAGTVGCCVLDRDGALATAASTGGLFDKVAGRVADTALVGAGVWCDAQVAVTCTGQGDYFIRCAAAARLAAAVELGAKLEDAARSTLDRITRLGGWGGLIALSAEGELVMSVRRHGMKCASLAPDGRVRVTAWPDSGSAEGSKTAHRPSDPR